jgi:hypothetical protein
LLVACGGDPDPCEGLATCVRLHVQSNTTDRIDTLELDLLYGTAHATTTTQASGAAVVDLPLVTGIEVATTQPIRVGIVAAGKLAGNVLGTGAATTTLDPSAHDDLALELAPVADCVAGTLYCGGDKLAGDPMTLYQCNAGGVPLARGLCSAGCLVRPAKLDTCAAAGGPCIEGGLYCGGDKLEGDPQTLYHCASGAGTQPMECTDGCVVAAPGTNDHCR